MLGVMFMSVKEKQKSVRKITDQSVRGKYVATRTLGSSTVVSSGTNPDVVAKRAQASGVKQPVISYVPKEPTTCLITQSE